MIYDHLYVNPIFLAKKGTPHQEPKTSRSSACHSHFCGPDVNSSGTKNKHITVEKKMLKSTIPTQAECVVFLPGRASRCMIVTMSFAQATVLCKSLVSKLVT